MSDPNVSLTLDWLKGTVKLSADLLALIKGVVSLRKTSPVAIVGERFLQVFIQHGVRATQIPRLLPSISLAALVSPESLLAALTPKVIDDTARLFGIRSSWLEGVTDQIYDTHYCYKAPARFFELLSQTPREPCSFPVRALTSMNTLDCHAGREQPIALVLVEPISAPENPDELHPIARYHIWCDDWDWGYEKSRVQLKAMIRIVDQVLNERVPLYHIERTVLEEIRSGRKIPRAYLLGSLLTNPSLEDYANNQAEHGQAKETEELPFVLAYIEHHKLTELLNTPSMPGS